MRAIIYERYGAIDELHLAEVDPPEPPAGGAVVFVKSAALNPKDALFRRGRFKRLSGRHFPKRTGVDFAGVVRVAAASVGVRPAERVFGALYEWRYRRGTLAEQVAVDAEEMAVLPEALDFDTGAALALTGMTALQALRGIARVGQGARVGIHGASGGVGTIAVQIARVLGAEVVTTSSERNFQLCRRLGAHETLDYASSPFGRRQGEFDCLFDVLGNRASSASREHCGALAHTSPPCPRSPLSRTTCSPGLWAAGDDSSW